MPFPNGKTAVLVEQPTYYGMLRSLDLLGVPTIGIKRTNDGIDLNELERHFRNNHVKFFYTVPRYHNPLGTSYNRDQKKQIAVLAEKYGVYIVEDDYLADLEIDSKADPIHSYDSSEHTIYIKSFSKVMLPGLRLAATVLPKSLIETFKLFKSASDLSSAVLSQAALEIFIDKGIFDRHAAHMRERYRLRMKNLRYMCDRYLAPEITIQVPQGGIFSQLLVPEQINVSDLAASLKQHNVIVIPTTGGFLRSFPKENAIRISIIRTDEKDIESGIQQISEQYENLLKHKKPNPLDPVIDWI